MKKVPFILSLVVHLGFFLLIINISSVNPEASIVEVSLSEPQAEKESKQSGEENANVIPKAETDAIGNQCEYTYGGIGIESGSFDVVSKVFEGYAADRAGLRVVDIMSYQGSIRGEPGTTLYLKVFRKGIYIDFTIIREKICYDM